MTDEFESITFNIDGYREARLDQVIAQELHADMDFAAWLWTHSGGHLKGAVSDTYVRMNCDDANAEFPVDAHGETDVRSTLTWTTDTASELLIENKVWAGFQPRQAERYRLRADHCGGRALLVAPADYPESTSSVSLFDGAVTIEQVAAWLSSRGDRRGHWLAELLTELVKPLGREPAPDDPNTVAFTRHCVEWLARSAPHVIPAPNSLHSTGQGWLDFETPAGLIYKVVGVRGNDFATVDLYFKYLGLDDATATALHRKQPCVIADGGPATAFSPEHDSQQNLVLRFRLPKLNPADGVPTGEQLDVLHRGLTACIAAANWAIDVAMPAAAGRVAPG
jgi:hypothetical protein